MQLVLKILKVTSTVVFSSDFNPYSNSCVYGFRVFGLSGKVFRLGFVQNWAMSVTFQVTRTDI